METCVSRQTSRAQRAPGRVGIKTAINARRLQLNFNVHRAVVGLQKNLISTPRWRLGSGWGVGLTGGKGPRVRGQMGSEQWGIDSGVH